MIACVLLLVLVAPTNVAQDAAPAPKLSVPERPATDDPTAREFLGSVVDKAMANLVDSGAKTATATLTFERAPNRFLPGRKFQLSWRKDPWAVHGTLLELPEELEAQRVQIEVSLTAAFQGALLFPSSHLPETTVLQKAEDGDLVRISMWPDEGVAPQSHRWFQKDGVIVRSRSEGFNPKGDLIIEESTFTTEKMGEGEGARHVVRKIEKTTFRARQPERKIRSSVEIGHTLKDGMPVVTTYFSSTPRGETAVTCEVTIDPTLTDDHFQR